MPELTGFRVELGKRSRLAAFISNREEARFLASEHGQTLIASGIYRAIRDFKVEYEKDLNLAETSSR